MKRYHERGWHRLFYTTHGDLDLSWFLVLVCIALAGFGFASEVLKTGAPSVAAWSFLAGAFMSVLIAAVPTNKARILANAKSPGLLASAISAAGGNVFKDNERDTEWDSPSTDAKAETGVGSVAPDSAPGDNASLRRERNG